MNRIVLILILLLSIIGCQSVTYDEITQVSTINSLLAGGLDGEITCKTLGQFGDFGIGTYNRLHGEMVLLDGVFYRVRDDGRIEKVATHETTPFATVNHFVPDTLVSLVDLNFDSLESLLDRTCWKHHLFYAIRIQGRFARVKTRSVPRQTKPYPPLAEIARNQPVFEFENVGGLLMGFRAPSFVSGLNVSGYHFHFISDDRTRGGHVLELELDEGTAEIDLCTSLRIMMPENSDHYRDAVSDPAALDAVER